MYDFYIPCCHTLIECDGSYWHSDPRFYPNREKLTSVQQKVLERDIKKNKLAKDNGYNLIRLWEYDLKSNREQIRETIRLVTLFFAP